MFGLDQADATARQIAAAGGPVRVLWYGGGHDGGAPDQRVRDAIGDWVDHWLAGRDGAAGDPGRSFGYTVASGIRTNGDTPTSRTVEAPDYPGLRGEGAVTTTPLALARRAAGRARPRGRQPGGGHLAARSRRRAGQRREPGGGVHRGAAGQSAQFRTEPVPAPLLVAGAPRVDLTVARVPGQPAADEAVLFGKLYEVSADGTRALLGGAVAPFRVPAPADGSPARVALTLPGVVAPIEAGNRLLVSIGTTDQGYAGATSPAVWRIGLDGDGGGGPPLSPCPSCPGRPSRPRRAAARCSALPACSAWRCWPGGCPAAPTPDAGTGRRPRRCRRPWRR